MKFVFVKKLIYVCDKLQNYTMSNLGRSSDKEKKHILKTISKKHNFPIKVQTYKQLAFIGELGIGIEQCVVMANGFVIAHFVDEQSMNSYMGWLQQYGFDHFPEKIMEILKNQADSGLKVT